jgi:hypothetical protein
MLNDQETAKFFRRKSFVWFWGIVEGQEADLRPKKIL